MKKSKGKSLSRSPIRSKKKKAAPVKLVTQKKQQAAVQKFAVENEEPPDSGSSFGFDEELNQFDQLQLNSSNQNDVEIGGSVINPPRNNQALFNELLAKTKSRRGDTDMAINRPNPNASLLQRKQPMLLNTQSLSLGFSRDEKRQQYTVPKYVPIEDIETWQEMGPAIVAEATNGNVTKGKTQMKKSKATKALVIAKKSKNAAPDPKLLDYVADDRFNSIVCLHKGKLELLEVDAMVLSTDGSWSRFDMAKSAYANAGRNFDEEIKFLKSEGVTPRATGEVVATCGYRLPCYYVFHAHVPLSGDKRELLSDCYNRALDLTPVYNIRHIAFPCLATGGYGYPREVACRTALAAVRGWLNEKRTSNTVEKIIFCTYTDSDYEIYCQLLPLYFPLGNPDKNVSFASEKVTFDDNFWESGFTYLPLDTISTLYAKGNGLRVCHTLDLSGCAPLLTDLLLYVLYKSGSVQTTIKMLNLNACIHISDNALAFAIKIMPNIETLTMNACPLISGRGVTVAAQQLQKLVSLSAQGCIGVQWVPQEHLSSKTKPTMQLAGSPVEAIQQAVHNDKNLKFDTTSTCLKVVILRTPSMQTKTPSIASQFNGKPSQDWEGALRFESLTVDGGSTIEVVECDTSFGHFVVDSRSIVVLPPIQTHGPGYHKLVSTAVTCGKGSCPIISTTQGGKKLAAEILKRANSSVEDTVKRLRQLQWIDQINCNSLLSMITYESEKLYETTLDKITSAKLKTPTWKELISAVEVSSPELSRLPLQLISKTLVQGVKVSHLTSKNESAVAALVALGKIVRLPNSSWFINDLKWFEELVNNRMYNVKNSDSTGKKLIPWLKKEDRVFSTHSLTDTIASDTNLKDNQVKSFMRALRKSGIYLDVPQPWWNEVDPEPAGVLFAALPSEPHVPLADYWPDYWRDGDQEALMWYELICSVPPFAFNQLLADTCRFATPVLIWQSGLLAQYGCTELLLKAHSDVEKNEYGVVAAVRTMVIDDNSEACKRIDAVLDTTFKLLRQVVESSLLASGVYVLAKHVKCPQCRVAERVHYFDISKLLTNSKEPVKCSTFKKELSLEYLAIDNYFELECRHGNLTSTAGRFVDGTGRGLGETSVSGMRCSFCNLYLDIDADSLYCTDCGICLECIRYLHAISISVGGPCHSVAVRRTNLSKGSTVAINKRQLHVIAYNFVGEQTPYIMTFKLKWPNFHNITVVCVQDVQNMWFRFRNTTNKQASQFRRLMNTDDSAPPRTRFCAELRRRYDTTVVGIAGDDDEWDELREEYELLEGVEEALVSFLFTSTACQLSVIPSDNFMGFGKERLEVGLKLEAKDRKNPHMLCVATVKGFNENGEVLITFDGWTDRFDYYCNITDPDLHPAGYAEHVAHKLEHPKSYETLPFKWLEYTKSQPCRLVPHHFFNEIQSAGCPDMLATAQSQSTDVTFEVAWRPKMRLEAVDRLNPGLTCVATVLRITKPGHVEIYFDGWSDTFNYEAETNSFDLHPIGYCEHVGQTLQPPHLYGKSFNWQSYLVEVESPPVPYEAFTEEQKGGCFKHSVYQTESTFFSETETSSDDMLHLPSIIEANMMLAKKMLAPTADPPLLILPKELNSNALSFVHRGEWHKWAVGHHQLIDLVTLNEGFAATSGLSDTYRGDSDASIAVEVDPFAIANQRTGWSQVIDGVYISGRGLHCDTDTLEKLCGTGGTQSQSKSKDSKKKAATGNRPAVTLHEVLEALISPLASGMAMMEASKILPSNLSLVYPAASESDPYSAMEAIYRYHQIAFHTAMALTACFGNSTKHEEHIRPSPSLSDMWVNPWGPTKNTDWTRPLYPNRSNGFIQQDMCVDESWLKGMMRTGSKDNEWQQQVEHTLPHIRMIFTSQNPGPVAPKMLENIWRFSYLSHILLPKSDITDFDIPVAASWCRTVRKVDLSLNKLTTFPKVLLQFTNLRLLVLAGCGITKLPSAIDRLRNLESLNLNDNLIKEIPASFSRLKRLRFLSLAAYPLFANGAVVKQTDLVQMYFDSAVYPKLTLDEVGAKVSEMAKKHEHLAPLAAGYKDSIVEGTDAIASLNRQLLKTFSRLDPAIVPEPVLGLIRLNHLDLSNQMLKWVNAQISRLKALQTLHLNNCLKLESVSQEVARLPLTLISLKGCPKLKNPPQEVVKRGPNSVLAYLKRLLSGFQECKRTKLMMVGLGGAGKTSLVRALLSGRYQTVGTQAHEITDGIDIEDWSVTVPKGIIAQLSDAPAEEATEQKINYSVWDFAGQSVYYNTHQFFISNRAIYLLLWNTRLGFEHAGLDFWLSSIVCHAPKAPIFVVGTHADQVFRADLPETELKRAFPQIVCFTLISAITGQGVQALADELFKATLQQKYMGERVPTVWLKLETHILSHRRDATVISYDEVHTAAKKEGMIESVEVREALAFLHELGSVQYFSNEFLRDRVVINPQWLVDVMACLISVKESVIQSGRFKVSDISTIWRQYPSDLHPWLLRLTEEFDLTFSLPGEEYNVVPCLLPEQEPPIDWPKITTNSGVREMKLAYRFEYLPAGLFNRAQTRLCQYSDTSAVWKKGSLLQKNQHMALIRQTRDNELVIVVQGARPENVLFLVHEVIETLIHEFFQGVSYDLSIPCSDCVRGGSQDPHMFSAKHVKRATDLKAPFLQCAKSFHIVALAALQQMVPPNTTAEYEQHLSGMMHDLKALKSSVSGDVLIVCTESDSKIDKNKIGPARIQRDLRAQEVHCRILDQSGKRKTVAAIGEALLQSSVIVAFITGDFCSNEISCNLFHFVKRSSHRPLIVVVGAKDCGWQTTSLGMLVAAELYVDMTNEARYEAKLKELSRRVQAKIKLGAAKSGGHALGEFDVFLSYCWQNSKDAVDRGTRKVDGAVGVVDPREIDHFLGKNNINCWLDVRCIDRDGVLFEELAEALRCAKCIVACVSDEYLMSRNSMLEFRFAVGILKLPLILCPVGTGRKWQTSEIAMLALGAPRIDFQTKSESDMDSLLSTVKETIRKEDEIVKGKKKSKSSSKEDNAQSTDTKSPSQGLSKMQSKNISAYDELCELAQRKFLLQVLQVATQLKVQDNALVTPYPRLVYLDTVSHVQNGTKRSKSKPRTAGASAKGKRMPHKNHSTNLDHLSTGDIAIFTLCEAEGAWHTSGEPLRLPETAQHQSVEELFAATAAYLAPLYSVLLYSPVSVRLFELYPSLLDDMKLMARDGNFTDAYSTVWRWARTADTKLLRGKLVRGSLHSRRVVWLCEEHVTLARGTIIQDDTADADDIALNIDGDTTSIVGRDDLIPLNDGEDADNETETKPNLSTSKSRKNRRNSTPLTQRTDVTPTEDKGTKDPAVKSKICAIS